MTITHQLSANVDLLTGLAASGYAKIEAVGLNDVGATVMIPAIRDTASDVIFTGPQRVKLVGGLLIDQLGDPLRLPESTGGLGFSPDEWSYRVTLMMDHLTQAQYPVYIFQLDADLDLADVVSVPPGSGAVDAPWQDAADAAEAFRDEAEAFRDELVTMLDDTAPRREGNRMDATSSAFHPANRPRSERFDGTSRPLSAYFPTLAAAQAVYPFATTLTDETDWAALQLAVASVVSFPRQFGSEPSDWRQYGTAAIIGPAGGYAKVNRPITKAANTNQNVLISSPAPWSFRIEYTGGDGGRVFDLERDSVGTVLVIENVLLHNGGIRVKAPYRGLILIGKGCQVVDSPHPAVQFEDTPTGVGGTGVGNPAGIGVVGPIVEKFYTSGCAGSVWQLSSTATITTFRDSRCLNNRDEAFVVDGSTDILVENIDFTGLEASAAAAGKGYMRIAADLATTNNVDIRDIRCGSEEFDSGSFHYIAPAVPLILGARTGATAQLGIVRLRKVQFRTPPVVSATVGRAAILMRALATLDVDDCDFGTFNDCLVDEAYLGLGLASYYSGAFHSTWGIKNTIDPGHTAPIFSNGGVTFESPGRLPVVIDQRTGFDPGDDANLVSTDLSTWSIANATIGARTAGGVNGSHYYPITKTAAGIILYKTLTLTAGRRYAFGINVRRTAGSAIRTIRMRAAIGATVMVDQRQVRLDSEWTTVWFRIPYVVTTGTCTFGFYLDNDELGAAGAVVDVQLPFVSEGWTPRIPRTGLRLATRLSAPSPATAGMIYTADGTSWDPLARAAALPYAVLWNGSTWQAVSNTDPNPALAPLSGKQTGGDLTLPQSDATNYTDIPGMSVTVAPGDYQLSAFIEGEGTTTADLKIRWGVTGLGASGSWAAGGLLSTVTAGSGSIQRAALGPTGAAVLALIGAGSGVTASPGGRFTFTTAGTFKLQATQGVAEASDVKVRNGSMLLTRVP